MVNSKRNYLFIFSLNDSNNMIFLRSDLYVTAALIDIPLHPRQ